MDLKMDEETYVLLNGAVTSTGLLITCFFCFCLLVPESGQEEGIKQPLLLLLWSVVGWNALVHCLILLFVCLTFSEIKMEWQYQFTKAYLLWLSSVFSMSPSMWLSIFYYIRIVPAQHTFFTWMTRNIKPIIYWGLAIDKVYISSKSMMTVALILSLKDNGLKGQNGSATSALVNISETGEGINLLSVIHGSKYIILSYINLGVIVMTSSSCATALYLWKHMKRMQATTSISFSSPNLQSQWRVTTTGITQAGLYIFSSMLIILQHLNYIVKFDINILCTVNSFISLGTMINFGFGQTLFRQRAADLWHKAVHITQLFGFNRA